MRVILVLGLLLLVLIGAAWGAIYFGAQWALPQVTQRLAPLVNAQSRPLGVTLSDWEIGQFRLTPDLRELRMWRVAARFDLAPDDRQRLKSTASAGNVVLRLDDVLRGLGRVEISDLQVVIDPADLPENFPFDRLRNGRLVVGDLGLLNPSETLRQLRQDLGLMLQQNYLTGEFEFDAEVVIGVDGITVPAQLYTERRGDDFRLRFYADDIETLSERLALKLTPQQVEVISLYPLRLVDLMQITDRARDIARRHYAGDRWRQDALRHVAWSYLLTQRFDTAFATEVTNAQESRPGNAPAERLMDYHNNAVGRALARDGVPLRDLPGLVGAGDERIVTHPDQVALLPPDKLLN